VLADGRNLPLIGFVSFQLNLLQTVGNNKITEAGKIDPSIKHMLLPEMHAIQNSSISLNLCLDLACFCSS